MPIVDVNTPRFRKARLEIVKKLHLYNKELEKLGDNGLKAIANEGVNHAKYTGNYTDQTGNLRNSIFSNPDYINLNFDSLPGDKKGKKSFPGDLEKSNVMEKKKGQRVGVIGAGMSYARHVENRFGYNVLAATRAMIRQIFGSRLKTALIGAGKVIKK
jgi:hypothetical protein